jgi:hypothetical protein
MYQMTDKEKKKKKKYYFSSLFMKLIGVVINWGLCLLYEHCMTPGGLIGAGSEKIFQCEKTFY